MSADGGVTGGDASDTGAVPAASVTFSAHAPQYTATRRRLVPHFDDFYANAVRALSLPGVGEIGRVLDLGAGTGLMTAFVSDAFPDARFDLLDGSAAMLEEAREVLAGVVQDVIVADMAGPLPGGPYDAVVSALAIHHLEDPDKRQLYRRVYEVLRPGGIFVNAEQVSSTDERWSELYRQQWAADAVSQGASEQEIVDSRLRREHDRCASVPAQLQWLTDSGFSAVDCLWKSWEGAVLVAMK